MGLPAVLGAGPKEDGADRVGEATLRPAIVDDCCPVRATATGRFAPPDGVTPGRAPPFCPTPAVVARAFAVDVEDLATVLPPGDAAVLLPAKALPELRVERFPVAALVPARLAAVCGLAVVAPETDRLAGEAASPLFGFPPALATVDRPTLPLATGWPGPADFGFCQLSRDRFADLGRSQGPHWGLGVNPHL